MSPPSNASLLTNLWSTWQHGETYFHCLHLTFCSPLTFDTFDNRSEINTQSNSSRIGEFQTYAVGMAFLSLVHLNGQRRRYLYLYIYMYLYLYFYLYLYLYLYLCCLHCFTVNTSVGCMGRRGPIIWYSSLSPPRYTPKGRTHTKLPRTCKNSQNCGRKKYTDFGFVYL